MVGIPTIDNPLLLQSTAILDVPTRVRKCLLNISDDDAPYSWGISLLGDLVQLQPGHMLRVPNFGKASLFELEKALAKIGLSLGMKVDGWTRRDVFSTTPVREIIRDKMPRVGRDRPPPLRPRRRPGVHCDLVARDFRGARAALHGAIAKSEAE
jgi:hypothetical protein